jgi:hypothetical protein
VEDLRENHDIILDELQKRFQKELKGTLYEVLEQQKVLSARYDNVADVVTDYLEDHDKIMLIQHHILMFMHRYYLVLDEEHPLVTEMVDRRNGEMKQAVGIYFEVWKQFTSLHNHSSLEDMHAIIEEIINQMGDFLNRHLDTLSNRLPHVKLRGIDYDEDSVFDIDPESWPA